MPFLALLTPKVWFELAVAAAIAGACWYAYSWAYDKGAASVQAKWDEEKIAQAEATAKVATAALETTKDLQAKADKRQEQANAQIKTLNASLATAIAGLSNRPSRPSQGDLPRDPTTGGSVPVCTPSKLYREDASVLIGLAGEADRLRIKLVQCQDAYAAARKALE